MTNLQEKRNQLITEAAALIQGKNVDAEKRAKFATMMGDVDTMDAQIELEKRSRPPRSQPNNEANNSAEERSKVAFRDWMRTGNISAENRSILRETRDLGATVGTGAQTTSVTASSVLIPIGFDPQLHSAAKSFGQLASNVRQLVTSSGEPQKVATSDDTACLPRGNSRY
jgi:HK97 family phage major capsid protein